MCTCGREDPHIIASRKTADGIGVVLWSDGPITGHLGSALPGVPIRRPRTPEARHLCLVAGRLLLGEVCFWDASEVGRLYSACEKATRGDRLPGTVRRLMRQPARPRLNWQVISADRSGTPTERHARLPRLRWPRTVVVDFCGGPGSAGGRYVIYDVKIGRRLDGGSHEWMEPSGFRFRTLDALWEHLDGC